jgi:hypothetical protein
MTSKNQEYIWKLFVVVLRSLELRDACFEEWILNTQGDFPRQALPNPDTEECKF